MDDVQLYSVRIIDASNTGESYKKIRKWRMHKLKSEMLTIKTKQFSSIRWMLLLALIEL